MHWGKADAPAFKVRRPVFDTLAGFAGVWHLDEEAAQEPLQLLAQPGVEADPVEVAAGVGLGGGQHRQGRAQQGLGLGHAPGHEARGRRILDVQGLGTHAP